MSAETYFVFLEKVPIHSHSSELLSSGRFYVLIDPKTAKSKSTENIRDPAAWPDWLLPIFKRELILEFDGALIYIEDLQHLINDIKVKCHPSSQTLDIDPLYGIFTSGSTCILKRCGSQMLSHVDFVFILIYFHITNDDAIGNQHLLIDISVKTFIPL